MSEAIHKDPDPHHEEHDERAGRGKAPAGIMLFVVVVALAMLGGLLAMLHDLSTIDPVAHQPAPLPTTRTLRHEPDAQQTYYIWTDRHHRLQSTRALERVPSWALATLEVWHPDFGERTTSRGGYIVDVLDAEPGQMLTATLRDRAWILAASQAADAGEAHGILTAYYAGELANLHPDSERNLAIDRLEHNLQEIEKRRPLTSQEIIEIIRAAQQQPTPRPQHGTP